MHMFFFSIVLFSLFLWPPSPTWWCMLRQVFLGSRDMISQQYWHTLFRPTDVNERHVQCCEHELKSMYQKHNNMFIFIFLCKIRQATKREKEIYRAQIYLLFLPLLSFFLLTVQNGRAARRSICLCQEGALSYETNHACYCRPTVRKVRRIN